MTTPTSPTSEVECVRIVVISFRNIAKKYNNNNKCRQVQIFVVFVLFLKYGCSKCDKSKFRPLFFRAFWGDRMGASLELKLFPSLTTTGNADKIIINSLITENSSTRNFQSSRPNPSTSHPSAQLLLPSGRRRSFFFVNYKSGRRKMSCKICIKSSVRSDRNFFCARTYAN